MKLTVTIQMDNAAFEPEPGEEAARVLREYADRIEGSARFLTEAFSLYDANGNHVGTAKVKN